ncbi:hypothetical protein AB0K51_13090 [Kitasatospora sp. NPDC049285]|uniref:hypothetical protein n=1 Tax=Kitasatospora sp. NPDC049285 TaxID=3157096 RepID=UPI003448A706
MLAHGLAPATTGRALALAARLLPPGGDAPFQRRTGAEAARGYRRNGALHRLTALGDRAAHRNNEPTAQ